MLGRLNAPSELVSVERVKADWVAVRVMCAAGSGRCCGSWNYTLELRKDGGVCDGGLKQAAKHGEEKGFRANLGE